MGSFLSQFASAFATPLGGTVLALALLGAAFLIVWAFWQKAHTPTKAQARRQSISSAPPPILAPDLHVGGAAAPVEREDTLLRNVLLVILAVVALLAAFRFLSPQTPPSPPAATTLSQAEALGTPMTPRQASASVPTVERDFSRLICEEGPIGEAAALSYRLCAARQAAQIDVISLARQGSPLLTPMWQPRAGGIVEAANQPMPFALGEEVEMIAAPGSTLSDYDAIVAIGMADLPEDPSLAQRLAFERGFSTGGYALSALRGEKDPAACSSPALVAAYSVGQYQPSLIGDRAEEAADHTALPVRPLLLGVRFDRRYPPTDRDLDALVVDFLSSNGVAITEFNLGKFQPAQKLFTEKACTRG